MRTAWVRAGDGVNFVATATRLLREGRVMRVVGDQVSTPTRARHPAESLWALAAWPRTSGLLQFTDAGVAVVPVDSNAYPRPARRPRVSLLDKHAGWDALGVSPVHWRLGVAALTLELLHA